MKLVVIESPYAGDTEDNIEYVKFCMLDCMRRGEAPFASHLLYTQVLDDLDLDQREYGLRAGWAWMDRAELVAVYIDRGISPGMMRGMNHAFFKGISVEFRSTNSRVTVPVVSSSLRTIDDVLEKLHAVSQLQFHTEPSESGSDQDSSKVPPLKDPLR